jgi:serine/threonine-protein kinase HipA
MTLSVHLYGDRIGTLFSAGDNDYRFAYDPELVDERGPGQGLLSNSLPLRREPFSGEATRAYVEGLLPQGRRRRRIGKELDVDHVDGYLMLAELGQDCPGAVTFVPEGEEIEARGPEQVQWLEEDELAELLKAPPPTYFGEDGGRRMRATLPGDRHKLSLVRDEQNDRWGWPEAGVPSTHVIKPDTGEYPEYIANEMFCMSLFRQVGLRVAQGSVEEIAGRRCIVSPRYDRVGEGLDAQRLHAETFAQALGISPDGEEGTEEGEAPDFAEASGLLNAVGRGDDLINLLNVAFCNYIVGNGDAHGRNFNLVDDDRRSVRDAPGSRWRIAPLTDITSTAVYDDPINTGMVIGEDYTETAYLLEIAYICEECEFDFEMLRGVAATTAEQIGRIVETLATRAANEGWYEPIVAKIVELAAERAFGLGAEVEY